MCVDVRVCVCVVREYVNMYICTIYTQAHTHEHICSVHPRLALLTGTVANALDDLWHTAILTVALMCCFSGIATWRFGPYLEEFADFETTMQVILPLSAPAFVCYVCLS